MKNKVIFWFLFISIMMSCHSYKSLVNDAHLDHLYEEINIKSTSLGTIWIYSESPDFHLVADSDEGFTCVDDVARALVMYSREMRVHPSEKILHKIKTLSAFIIHMQASNGYFYNFMFHDGSINKTHVNSEARPSFWTWRAYWALSEVMLINNKKLVELQKQCLIIMDEIQQKVATLCTNNENIENFEGISLAPCVAKTGADQLAIILIALANNYRVKPTQETKNIITNIGHSLLTAPCGNETTAPHNSFLSWQNYWLAWGNSEAYALLVAGHAISDKAMILGAMNEVNHFYPYMIESGYLSSFKVIIDDNKKLQMKDLQSYPQIAYGISPMILASVEAWKITDEQKYLDLSLKLSTWFFGKNNAKVIAYDKTSGRCIDGINGSNTYNKNSGAESTIEALLSMQAIEQFHKEKTKYNAFILKTEVYK
jgi:hypothetical protein